MPDKGRDHERDAFGFKVEYNPEKGTVSSRGVNAKRAIQSAALINDLSSQFFGEKNHHPKDLEELRDYVREIFNEANPASFNVVDALGEDLDVTRSPIDKWDYDPNTGAVNLPPYCEAKTLFKPADRLFKPKE